MQQRRSKLILQGMSCVMLSSLPFVASCGDSSDKPVATGGVEQTHQTPDLPRYMPFSIRFDLKGNPVVVDEKGNPVAAELTKLPVRATSVAAVQSISVVTYTGSCKQVFNIGGKLLTYTLPDSYCASL